MKIFSVRNFAIVKILILAQGVQKNSGVGSVAIFTLAWQFLTNNSSPDILVDSHPEEVVQVYVRYVFW